MLRFTLFGFPISIHWSFWITSAMLSGLLFASSPQQFQADLLAVAVVAFSILWHELGHAFFMRRYGGPRTHIYLYYLGGLASTQNLGFSDRQRLIISAAGPAAGLFLALLFYLAFSQGLHFQSFYLEEVIWTGLYINLVWTVLNLFPVHPLDGGQIMEAIIGGRRPLLVHRISFLVALVSAIGIGIFLIGPVPFTVGGVPMVVHPTFFAILLGLLAYENYQRMNFRSPRTPW